MTSPPSSDLVARLRQNYCSCSKEYTSRRLQDPGCESCSTKEERHEAADTIERLERERDAVDAAMREEMRENAKRAATIDRLRVALEKYGEHLRSCRTKDWTAGKHSWDDAACDCGLREALKNP